MPLTAGTLTKSYAWSTWIMINTYWRAQFAYHTYYVPYVYLILVYLHIFVYNWVQIYTLHTYTMIYR